MKIRLFEIVDKHITNTLDDKLYKEVCYLQQTEMIYWLVLLYCLQLCTSRLCDELSEPGFGGIYGIKAKYINRKETMNVKKRTK